MLVSETNKQKKDATSFVFVIKDHFEVKELKEH